MLIMDYWLIARVRNWVVRVRENLLISFFRSAWTGEGEWKNNSQFTEPNYPISDSANRGGVHLTTLCGRHMWVVPWGPVAAGAAGAS